MGRGSQAPPPITCTEDPRFVDADNMGIHTRVPPPPSHGLGLDGPNILSKFVLILNRCTCYASLTVVMKILLNYMFNVRIKNVSEIA